MPTPRPLEVPEAVHRAMCAWAAAHPNAMHHDCDNRGGACLQCQRGYPELEWDYTMGCYYFVRNGMFHGVEVDGYIHT